MSQLPLALRLNRHASFETFVAGHNAAAVEHVRSIAEARRRESIWLTGAAGTGKTHLLAAACRAADESGARSMYLAVDPAADPGVVARLEQVDLLALDDLHRVAGRPDWEAALFSVLNDRLERGRLLMAADHAPRECGFAIADLVSRAGAAVLYRLSMPDDEVLLRAVQLQAYERGVDLDEAAARFLLSRVRRDFGELIPWLERIDRYSLAAKRRVTVPLLRQLLEFGVDE